MELITSFYYPSNLQRLNELKESIKNNIKKDFIEKINLIITEKDLNKSMKIVDAGIKEFIYENSKKN